MLLTSSGLSAPEHLLSLAPDDLQLALTSAGLTPEDTSKLIQWTRDYRAKPAAPTPTHPYQLLTAPKAALMLPTDGPLRPNPSISKETERLKIRLNDIQQERMDAQEARALLLSIDVASYRRVLKYIVQAQECLRSA